MALYDYILNTGLDDTIDLKDIHLSDSNTDVVSQLLKEFKYVNVLSDYGLPVDNKLLLFGHTGCGKTTTAKAIAKALDKKIYILNLGGIVSSRLGETAKNITEVFNRAFQKNAVLFLDEFDYIGKLREFDNQDSGEMKRLVNTVIQLIDQLPKETLLIAATNHSAVIDTALLRRFQLKLKFEAPSQAQLDTYYDALLEKFPAEFRHIDRLYSLSYAEAKDITFRAVKHKVIAAEEAKMK